jgi:hypothetical protein
MYACCLVCRYTQCAENGHQIDCRGTMGTKKMLFMAYLCSNYASDFLKIKQQVYVYTYNFYSQTLFADECCILQYIPKNIFRSLIKEETSCLIETECSSLHVQ